MMDLDQDYVAEQMETLVFEEPILKLFRFKHLREDLRAISFPFAWHATVIVQTVPRNPERTVCLRKLRESKDCAVTAFLWDEEVQ